MFFGTFERGVLVGTRMTTPEPGKGNPKTYIGISQEFTDQYGVTSQVTKDIQVPAKHAQHVVAQCMQLKDKLVEVPIFISAWAGSRGANHTLFLDSDRPITEVKDTKPALKAS